MSDLRRRLDALYEKKVVGTVEQKVIHTARGILVGLKTSTPVDTARAVTNWHTDLGAPTVKLLEPNKNEDYLGAFAAETASYTVDKTIFISNNLPYIRRLNDGYSKQEPAGFVERSIQAGQKDTNRRFL